MSHEGQERGEAEVWALRRSLGLFASLLFLFPATHRDSPPSPRSLHVRNDEESCFIVSELLVLIDMTAS